MRTNRTSLYVSEICYYFDATRKQVRKEIWEFLKQVAEENSLQVLEEERKQNITFNKTNISFRVMDAPQQKRYLLSFQPAGDVSYWGSKACNQASEDVLSFCELMGDQIGTSLGLNFNRMTFQSNDKIDISEWDVFCPFEKPSKKVPLRNFLITTRQGKYENIFKSSPKDITFYTFSDSYRKGTTPFEKLKNLLRTYGTVKDPTPIRYAREFSENIAPGMRNKSIFIFLEEESKLKQHYERYKVYFDSNKVPTQYVLAQTVEKKLPFFQGVNANLILEIMTKLGMQPVILQAPEEIFENDGFLCLSDIPNTSKQRLFGALFTYADQGLKRLTEDVQIYDDLNFESSNYTLKIDEENVQILCEKIRKLTGRTLKVDVLLTKRWNEENVQNLVKTLNKLKIKVKRIYYISTRTSRFVDDFLTDYKNVKSFLHPYLIINRQIAFIKMSTETRIYPNLFSIFIELLYPLKDEISLNDLDKILWLAKKRIYRIQEFSLLKELEPIYVFKNLRKMYLSNIHEKLTIPMKLLI